VDLQRKASDALGNLLAGLSSRGVASGVAEGASAPDPLDQLKKLADLRESGAITPAEYEEYKAKLLAKLSREMAR
jgi:hypothetical protein